MIASVKTPLMKLAVVVIANPEAGDEALARLFNALAVAYEADAAGDEVALTFIGTGTRWPEQLSKLTHPANGRYNQLRHLVQGASRSCSMRWGAAEANQELGVALLDENKIPGTPGGASLRRYLVEGWQTLIF
jgi:hypothetical protein